MYNKIDYTLLKPTATFWDFYDLCKEAKEKHCASVCIPSGYVKEMKEQFPTLNICTVVGFPFGNNSTETKIMEAMKAIIDGANEIDMVINIAWLKDDYLDSCLKEINAIKQAIGKHILKVIIETCYLTDEEIATATEIVDESNADYIKTSTGFGTSGATVHAIEIIKENLSKNFANQFYTKIKASGGIRTREEMEKYISLGCDRIGASVLPE